MKMFKLFLLLFVSSFLPCTWQIADDSIYINVYYEALCPRTREFFITQLSPALLAFPNLIQYRIIPFGEAEAKWNYNTNKFDFDCDIGSEDCIGNRIHNCLIYMMPSFKQHFPFINCTMVNQRVSRLQQVTECAKQFPNIPIDDVMKCANSTMGSQLLWGAGAETLNLIPKLLRTPWIVANNIRTSQNQQAIQFDYFNWLCTQLTTEIYEPSKCKYGQGWSIENPPGGYPLSGMLNFTLAETGYWNL